MFDTGVFGMEVIEVRNPIQLIDKVKFIINNIINSNGRVAQISNYATEDTHVCIIYYFKNQ